MASGGKNKDKESKKESKGSKKSSSSASSLSVPGGAGEEVDTSEADLVALLATQAMKEEKKRLKPGLKQRKKGGKTVNKKISE